MSNAPISMRLLLGLSVVALLSAAVAGFGLFTGSEPPAGPNAEDLVAGLASDLREGTQPEATSTTEDSEEHFQPHLAPIGAVAVPDDDLQATTTTAQPATTGTDAPPTTEADGSPTSTAPKRTTTAPKPTTTAPQSDLKASGPVTIQGKSGVVIENLAISNPNGPCIRVVGSSDVTIRNSQIGPCGNWGVFIDKSSGVTVQGNTIRTDSSKGGVYGHSSSTIAVIGNSITRSGRNPIQFDKVTGGGNRIEGNTVTNSPAEDMISLFKSGGTSGSWLRVTNNRLRNNTGKSNSGSGIMLGDAGGSYILVQGNSLADPGQAGIGVAGGSNIRVLGNTLASDAHSWSNVGIYVWDQYNSNCHAIEVRGNKVNWLNKHGQRNSAWDGGGCGVVAGWNDNDW